jgi:hypothetical protein
MAQVIGAEGHLEAVRSDLPLGDVHHARVVEQQIQRAGVDDPRRRCSDRLEVAEIQHQRVHLRRGNLRMDLRGSRLQSAGVTSGQPHTSAVTGQNTSRLPTDATVATGDQRNASSQVADLVWSPGSHQILRNEHSFSSGTVDPFEATWQMNVH